MTTTTIHATDQTTTDQTTTASTAAVPTARAMGESPANAGAQTSAATAGAGTRDRVIAADQLIPDAESKEARGILGNQYGLSTIEYAMGTLAAAALAAVLYMIINSDAVSDALEGIINDALSSTPN